MKIYNSNGEKYIKASFSSLGIEKVKKNEFGQNWRVCHVNHLNARFRESKLSFLPPAVINIKSLCLLGKYYI